jgi:hypothetical protein
MVRRVKNARRKTALVFVLLAAAFAGPGAAQADTGLLVVTTTGKLRATKHVDVNFYCTANCSVAVTRHLKVPGPDPADTVVSGSFLAAAPARYTITFNNKARRFIRHDRKKCGITLTFQVTNTDTGAPDTVVRTFGFKK